MKVIWYNADQKKYKYGEEAEYEQELVTASIPENFTLFMKFKNISSKKGGKVLRQLNKEYLPFFL